MVKLVFIFAFSLICISSSAQTIVSGESGTLRDTANQTTVDYKVNLSGQARMVTWGAKNYCGIYWTGIPCPTMGNSEEEGIVTYQFSKPITAIDLFLCHVNMNGSIAPEVIGVNTNHGTIQMQVDSGSCAPWKVEGNVLTSPSVEGGINVIVHINSDSAFTILTIRSSDNERTGGAGTAFVENSVKQYLTSTPFVVPPQQAESNKKRPRKKNN